MHPPQQRLAFIDNLRWSAISMVVVMHAAVTYSPFGSWYYRERPPLSLGAKLAFATYQTFQHAVSMGLLFGIAGYFAAGAIARKGAAGFLRERAYRLGLPLLAYLLLIGPVTEYYVAGNWHATPSGTFAAEYWLRVQNGRILDGSGPLWFCSVLLAFSLAYAAIHTLLPSQRRNALWPVPGPATVLGYTVAMAAATFAVAASVPVGLTLLNVVVYDFPQYPLMFAAGIMARRHDWLRRIPSRAGRAWLLGGLAGSAALWALLITQGGALEGGIRAYYGGWHWQAAGLAFWRAATCLSLCLGLVTLYRDRFDGQGPIARFLTRNAFGVYVFHAPILIAITRLMRDWPAGAGVKFALASLAAIAASFAFVGFVARRARIVRAII